MSLSIPLSQGRSVLVDELDHERFSALRWCFRQDKSGYCYAVRNAKVNGKWRLQYLHREIMQPGAGETVIFLNHDTLDCRRDNLRVVPINQARRHHRVRKDSKTGLKGVKYDEKANSWRAQIRVDGVLLHLGSFYTAAEASAAYERACDRVSRSESVFTSVDDEPVETTEPWLLHLGRQQAELDHESQQSA